MNPVLTLFVILFFGVSILHIFRNISTYKSKKTILSFIIVLVVFSSLVITRETVGNLSGNRFKLTTSDLFILIVSFGLIDFLKTFAEEFANLVVLKKNRLKKLSTLSRSEVAILIPVHNGEDHIEKTLQSLPKGYKVLCVINNSTDNSKTVLRKIAKKMQNLELVDVTYEEKGKPRAIATGALKLKEEGYSYFLLLDDDIIWPENAKDILIKDRDAAINALPVMVKHGINWITIAQRFEYISMCSSKRAQSILGADITMASGAAGIYSVNDYLITSQLHTGKQVGDDYQTSYISHLLNMRVEFCDAPVILSDVPYTFGMWWRQRTRRWNLSLYFNLPLVLRALFFSKSMSLWGRYLCIYRLILVANLFLKIITFPYLVVNYPIFLILYYFLGTFSWFVRYLNSSRYFDFKFPEKRFGVKTMCVALTYFLYRYFLWFSRLYAFPKGIVSRVKIKSSLSDFIKNNTNDKKVIINYDVSKMQDRDVLIFFSYFAILFFWAGFYAAWLYS